MKTGPGEGGLNEGWRCSFLGSHRTTHGFSKPNIQLPQDGPGRCRRGEGGVFWVSFHSPELLSSNAQQWVLFWGGEGMGTQPIHVLFL